MRSIGGSAVWGLPRDDGNHVTLNGQSIFVSGSNRLVAIYFIFERGSPTRSLHFGEKYERTGEEKKRIVRREDPKQCDHSFVLPSL